MVWQHGLKERGWGEGLERQKKSQRGIKNVCKTLCKGRRKVTIPAALSRFICPVQWRALRMLLRCYIFAEWQTVFHEGVGGGQEGHWGRQRTKTSLPESLLPSKRSSRPFLSYWFNLLQRFSASRPQCSINLNNELAPTNPLKSQYCCLQICISVNLAKSLSKRH